MINLYDDGVLSDEFVTKWALTERNRFISGLMAAMMNSDEADKFDFDIQGIALFMENGACVNSALVCGEKLITACGVVDPSDFKPVIIYSRLDIYPFINQDGESLDVSDFWSKGRNVYIKGLSADNVGAYDRIASTYEEDFDLDEECRHANAYFIGLMNSMAKLHPTLISD